MALDALYQAEIRDSLPLETFDDQLGQGKVVPAAEEGGHVSQDAVTTADAIAYGRSLVGGVQEHLAEIDILLADYADRWAIKRMPVIDRTLLRIAVYEILWAENTPIPVAINEAVELAKELSTEDSGRFINGLLGRIAERADAPEKS